MLAPAPKSQRVRCRPIAETDLGGLAGFLAEGFPRTKPQYWAKGFERWKALPAVEGMPRFGYMLENETGTVGAVLLISSRRDQRIIANLSSWYVEPEYRAHSAMLVAMATRNKQAIYLNASPAPHTWRSLQAQGFHLFNFGRSAAFPALSFGGGTVKDFPPGILPERELLRMHSAMGCISLVWEQDGETLPFVFKPRLLTRPRIPMMEMIYCRSADDFRRAGAALGRHLFFKHGAWGVILDGKISGMPSRYIQGKEPRYFKGPQRPDLNDLAFTEKVLFS